MLSTLQALSEKNAAQRERLNAVETTLDTDISDEVAGMARGMDIHAASR